MSVILGIPITRMDNVSINGFVTDGPSSISKLIRRRNEVAMRQSKLETSLAALLATCSLDILVRLEVIREAGNIARRLADRRRRRRQVVILSVLLRVVAWPGTEVRGFIHIDPKTVDVDTIMLIEESLELIVPPLLCDVGVEPIREDGYAGPDST